MIKSISVVVALCMIGQAQAMLRPMRGTVWTSERLAQSRKHIPFCISTCAANNTATVKAPLSPTIFNKAHPAYRAIQTYDFKQLQTYVPILNKHECHALAQYAVAKVDLEQRPTMRRSLHGAYISFAAGLSPFWLPDQITDFLHRTGLMPNDVVAVGFAGISLGVLMVVRALLAYERTELLEKMVPLLHERAPQPLLKQETQNDLACDAKNIVEPVMH